MIPLTKETITHKEIDNLIEWLKEYPKLTKGDLTLEFEKKWSEYQGCEYSIFVNSGSSANLLMIYALIENGALERGDTVIVPALSWATSLAPIVQFGLNPILCDCNLEDLSIDIEHFKDLITKHNPKVLMMVSILGLVPNMELIKQICDENNIILLEDTCESLGSEYKGTKLGNFGLMSSFSTYFGHHMSTIEGGVICTNDKNIANLLRGLRSHGWDRDMDSDYVNQLRSDNNVSEFNALYTFYHWGFNVRSTDLQAYIGIGQLDSIKEALKKRNENYYLFKETLNDSVWKPKDNDYAYVSNMAYPIVSKNRDKIVKNLKDAQIECRPLLCGSLSRQPHWIQKYGEIKLKNADFIHENGLYVPNNNQMTAEEIKKICNIINESN
jgi:CDP-6-deoxy-D-xylo-4-hexulose-3-dehydrase